MRAITVAVEDILSAAIARKLIESARSDLVIAAVLERGGYGYLRRRIQGFNQAAQGHPFLVLTDLDRADCAASLVKEWLPHGPNPDLLLRVAVREVEAWLLADDRALAGYLGVDPRKIAVDVEQIADPKQHLIDLVRRSARREVRSAIVPREGSTAQIGPGYNGCLIEYVSLHWDVARAARRSDSLARAVSAIRNLGRRRSHL